MAISASRDWNTTSSVVSYTGFTPVLQQTTDQTENLIAYKTTPITLSATKEWLEYFVPTYNAIVPVLQETTDQRENYIAYKTTPITLSVTKEWLEYYNVAYSGLTPITTKTVTGGAEVSAAPTVIQIWKTGY